MNIDILPSPWNRARDHPFTELSDFITSSSGQVAEKIACRDWTMRPI